MQHLLIISFDEVLRTESVAFHLMEKTVQLLKRVHPDAVVDYFDLLQEQVETETIQRFSFADKIIFVFSALNKVNMPENFVRALDRLQYFAKDYHWPAGSILLLSEEHYTYLSQLKLTLETIFQRSLAVVSKDNLLAKELFSLQEQAEN